MIIMASGIACVHIHTYMHIQNNDNNDDDRVTQHGNHTPANRLTETLQPLFTAYIFDIGHPCYGHLTPVKTRYLMTSMM